MKTIYLVTGAAGFMGTNVCAQLLERGDAVRAFVLKGDPAVKFMPKAVEIFEGDLCSAEDCEKFFAVEPGVQTVCIHCASMVTINPNYSEKLIAVNVGGTENMLNAAKNHPECKKFVYVSSTGAIPELPKGESIHEVYSFVPYDDDRVVGWYSRSKAMATQKVLDAAADGLNACVVHPSGILGPNDRGRQGECYLLSNVEVSLKELCEMLKADTGCRGCLFYLPLSFAHFAAKQMEARAAKTGKPAVLTEFAVYNLERNNHFDCSKAKNELGFAPRPYKETLHDLAVWLKQEGKIA